MGAMPCSSIWRGKRAFDALAQKPAGQQLAARQNRRARQLVSYQDIIAMFLQHLAAQAQQHMGGLPERVVLGRPVHFVDGNPERDALAQASLEAAAHTAGFKEVAFQLSRLRRRWTMSSA